ncbi:MAG: ArnT family glycosyltransferase [Acidobacteriota bacterium]
MQIIRRYRIPALFCALAVLACELLVHPFVSMGIVDDGPYIRMAQHLAQTGHIVYNGWSAPMLGWQLYLGAAFIRLFGFTFTTVRTSTLLVAAATAWLLQRTLVRAGISERNATLGTLAFVLSPLYLMLSVTYMTDIDGLFASVICLYGCLRALEASSESSTIAWLCFAVVTNAIFGTARQIPWLGILVMVPCTLYLLRARRRVLFAGSAATFAGALFILACMGWLLHEPYVVHEHLIPKTYSIAHGLWDITYSLLDIPFLLLAIVVLFFPQLRKLRPRTLAVLAVLFAGYCFVAIHPSHLRSSYLLEPIPEGIGEWVNIHGMFEFLLIKGEQPIFLGRNLQILLTFASFGGMLGLIVSLLRNRRDVSIADAPSAPTWTQLGLLLGPFTLVYSLLLFPRASSTGVHDRYLLPLLVIALLCITRYYQERVRPQIPLAGIVMVCATAIYGTVIVHNMFSFYRARAALAAEIRAGGVRDTEVDNGWEYNFVVELRHSSHINEPNVPIPADAYVPPTPLPADTCQMLWYASTPHIRPLYGISFDPNACYGPAPFAPVHYSRWPYRTPGALYVVRYLPPSQIPHGMP